MDPAYPSYPPQSPPSPSRQNKVVLQREYREKEIECFNMLRDIIKDLTGAEVRTRQEILRKVIDILLTASEMRKQKAVDDSLHETHTPTHQGTSHTAGWQDYTDYDDIASLYDIANSQDHHNQQYYYSTDPSPDYLSNYPPF